MSSAATNRGAGALAAAVLVAMTLSACGDGEKPAEEPQPLTETAVERLSAPELQVVRHAHAAVGSYCGRLALALIGRGKEPSVEDYGRVVNALDELIALARRVPDAQSADGSTPELALADIAEDVEGANCDPRLIERIESALAELPDS